MASPTPGSTAPWPNATSNPTYHSTDPQGSDHPLQMPGPGTYSARQTTPYSSTQSYPPSGRRPTYAPASTSHVPPPPQLSAYSSLPGHVSPNPPFPIPSVQEPAHAHHAQSVPYHHEPESNTSYPPSDSRMPHSLQSDPRNQGHGDNVERRLEATQGMGDNVRMKAPPRVPVYSQPMETPPQNRRVGAQPLQSVPEAQPSSRCPCIVL